LESDAFLTFFSLIINVFSSIPGGFKPRPYEGYFMLESLNFSLIVNVAYYSCIIYLAVCI